MVCILNQSDTLITGVSTGSSLILPAINVNITDLQGQAGCKVYFGGIEAAMFVPAHAEASADIKELVRYNRDKVHEVADQILSICKEPICFESILQKVFKGYGLTTNFEQYVLAGSTVHSCLSWLKDTGKMAAEFQDNMLLWQWVKF